VLKQPQYQPMPVESQIAIIYAVTNGFLDDVEVRAVRQWESDFLEYMALEHAEILKAFRTKKLDDELVADLERAIKGFKALE